MGTLREDKKRADETNDEESDAAGYKSLRILRFCDVKINRKMPSAFCLLPSAFCLLPFAFCLLPFAFQYATT
jgi:hypothetical protein